MMTMMKMMTMTMMITMKIPDEECLSCRSLTCEKALGEDSGISVACTHLINIIVILDLGDYHDDYIQHFDNVVHDAWGDHIH